ncbi:MAG TPA: hypothetical protein VMV41_08355 [Cellulomonadaceae bacterium]|nr:hypothetical protein [Cellulomonadaceae bacterium]
MPRIKGDLIERRVVLPGGFEVELGFVDPAWVAEPVDAGTRRVVLDGTSPLDDPDGLLATLLIASAGPKPQPDGTRSAAPRT